MTPVDWIKLAIILPVFFGLGPALGAAVKDRPGARRWLFAAMCFMTINGLFAAGNWGLTLASVETYRGHAKGYHFYFNHIFAIALITAEWLGNRRDFRWFPPGMVLYALFIFCAALSIVNAPRQDYVLMALHKMVFFAIIALAAFNSLKTAEDLQFFLRVMAVTMLWQGFIVLKMKYLQGIYQVRGTFEHQNPLSMYAVMIGMPLLAAGLGPKFRGQALCLAGFAACGIIVQSALSRAALLMFAAGAAGVAIASLVEKPTSRRITVLSLMSLAGMLGLILTLDTIVSRFHDEGNTASSELREVLNEAARQMERAHPLGIGWNNYALCINTPYPYADVVYEWIRGRNMRVDETKPNAPVESHYYLLLGENGYPGLIAWLLVIASGMARNLWGFFSFRHGFERCLCLGILAGTALNYAQSTLERVLTQPRNLMLWLILFAITARLDLMRRARKNAVAVEGGEPAAGEADGLDAPRPAELQSLAPPAAAAPPGETPEARGGPEKSGKPLPSPPLPVWARKTRFSSPASSGSAAPPPAPAPSLSGRCSPWRKRRFWLACAASLLLCSAMATAWLRGRQTRIILINPGDETLPPVTVLACGRERVVPPLEGEASHRWTPEGGGPAGPVTVLFGGHVWTGGWLTPDSGQRIILRLLPDGTVEERHALSPWLEWLGE